MVVLIGNIPPGISERDLQQLVQPPGEAPVRIVKKRDRNGGLYRYALVHTPSERDGLKIIRRVDGRICVGSRLVARQYNQRLVSNERRRLDWREVPWTGVERRLGERRVSDSR